MLCQKINGSATLACDGWMDLFGWMSFNDWWIRIQFSMRSIKHTPKRNAIERKLHSAIRNTRGDILIVGIFSRGDITSKLALRTADWTRESKPSTRNATVSIGRLVCWLSLTFTLTNDVEITQTRAFGRVKNSNLAWMSTYRLWMGVSILLGHNVSCGIIQSTCVYVWMYDGIPETIGSPF